MEKSRAHMIIRGRVQGVFFRSTARNIAKELLLTGWVKNRSDGTVEAIVEGEKGNIAKFVEWAHDGPASAKVSEVEVMWEEYSGRFNDFTIEYI